MTTLRLVPNDEAAPAITTVIAARPLLDIGETFCDLWDDLRAAELDGNIVAVGICRLALDQLRMKAARKPGGPPGAA